MSETLNSYKLTLYINIDFCSSVHRVCVENRYIFQLLFKIQAIAL
jgi:hypothetical protein